MNIFGIGKNKTHRRRLSSVRGAAPKPTVRRLPARPARPRGRRSAALRYFDSAVTDRLTAGWTTTPKSADDVVRECLRTLRARSREQVCNNDYAKKFTAMVKGNVVGPRGAVLTAMCVGMSGKPDYLANQCIEENWREWCEDFCDIEGQNNWLDQQRLFVGAVAEDGESLLRHYTGRFAGKYQYATQLIDPETLDVDHNEDGRSGASIKMGMEFNRYNQRTAYYLRTDSKDSTHIGPYGRRYHRVPASDIEHAFLPDRVGQSRGLPWMGASLARMQMLDGFEDSALVAARAGANNLFSIIGDDGDSYAGESDGSGGTYMDTEPGSVNRFDAGTEIQMHDPAYPHGEFGSFVKSILRGISAGLLVSYNSLANDLEGVNFSSLRAGAIEERDVWMMLQEVVLIARLCRPVYNHWLKRALLSGELTINGKPLKQSRIRKYSKVQFNAHRWPWVDPLKDVNASEKAISMCLTTYTREAAKLGSNFHDNVRQQQLEREAMAAAGITSEQALTGNSGNGKEAGDGGQDADN